MLSTLVLSNENRLLALQEEAPASLGRGGCHLICDEYSKYASVISEEIEDLELYKIRDLRKYGYYLTKEEAEKALEEMKNNGNNNR